MGGKTGTTNDNSRCMVHAATLPSYCAKVCGLVVTIVLHSLE